MSALSQSTGRQSRVSTAGRGRGQETDRGVEAKDAATKQRDIAPEQKGSAPTNGEVRGEAQRSWPYVARKVEPTAVQRISSLGPMQYVTVLSSQNGDRFPSPVQRVTVQRLVTASARVPVPSSLQTVTPVSRVEFDQVARREKTAPASLTLAASTSSLQNKEQMVMTEPALSSNSVPPTFSPSTREQEAKRMVTRMLSAPASPIVRNSARVASNSYERQFSQFEVLKLLPPNSRAASPAASLQDLGASIPRTGSPVRLISGQQPLSPSSIPRSGSPVRLISGQQQPLSASSRGRALSVSLITPRLQASRSPTPLRQASAQAILSARRAASADPRATYSGGISSPIVPLAVQVSQISRAHELKRVQDAQKLLKGMLTPSPPLSLLESASAPSPAKFPEVAAFQP